VQLLLRLCGEQGALIRATLRRDKALKLPVPPSPSRPYSAEEKARMLEEAQKLRTPQMHAALALDLNTGLRDEELREIRWEQIDLVRKKALWFAPHHYHHTRWRQQRCLCLLTGKEQASEVSRYCLTFVD
jgi:integrase